MGWFLVGPVLQEIVGHLFLSSERKSSVSVDPIIEVREETVADIGRIRHLSRRKALIGKEEREVALQ